MKIMTLRNFPNEVNYHKRETQYICRGFKEGFDLGYRGLTNRQDQSSNLPFTVCNTTELWNKVIEEVKQTF